MKARACRMDAYGLYLTASDLGVHMKRSIVLTTTSLLAIILLSLHLTDDIVYGTDASPA